MKEMRRILKPGGLLVIGQYCYLPKQSKVVRRLGMLIVGFKGALIWRAVGCLFPNNHLLSSLSLVWMIPSKSWSVLTLSPSNIWKCIKHSKALDTENLILQHNPEWKMVGFNGLYPGQGTFGVLKVLFSFGPNNMSQTTNSITPTHLYLLPSPKTKKWIS